MYQTFYIDVDEEVNSVISKIRKSSAKYNILVIAQQALILQSSVSLKLIKKEMDALDKKVMLVTKDERATLIAQKIGFPVKSSLEEVTGAAGKTESKQVKINVPEEVDDIQAISADESEEILNKRNRLNNLGTDSFLTTGESIRKSESTSTKRKGNIGSNFDFKNRNVSREDLSKGLLEENSFEDLFVEPKNQDNTASANEISVKKMGKFLLFFVGMLGVLIGGLLIYSFVPRAEVALFLKKEKENINLKLEVVENVDAANKSSETIRVKANLIEDEKTLALSFETTGQKGSVNQKSRGIVTIYNEFSETSQVLVATTRFLSNDGKLFRLVKTVTVPGMVVKDGKVEPGKIEAEIIADESGGEFNIKEGTFNIPGFQGSAKYDKFYAKLNQETKGGGDSSNELKTVSQSDIEGAKAKAEAQLKTQLKESLKNKIGPENNLIEDALAFEVVDFSVFPEEGAVSDSFEYQVKMRIKGLIFSNKELDDKIAVYIKENILSKNSSAELISVSKEYGRADIDFGNKSIKTELNLNVNYKNNIDTKSIINDLLGKNPDEINNIMKNHPGIEKIEVAFYPSFMSNKFPKYSSRIKIEIQEVIK